MAYRGGWLDLTTSLVALGPSMVQALVRIQNCFCWPKYLSKYMKKGTLRDISLMNIYIYIYLETNTINVI